MASDTYDVAIVGLGAMGSAAAYHLARRGQRVLGLDQFRPPHDLGSSHGKSRIIREAYAEDPAYVPLVQRAYELWAALEHDGGEPLLRTTGGLMIGPPDGGVVTGALASAEAHGLRHELLDAAELRRRAPALRPSPDTVAVWEPRAGVLAPERCVATHLRLAEAQGATLRFDEPVGRWRPDGDGVRLTTSAGEYRAGRLLITAGAWASRFLTRLDLPLRPTRQVFYWFEPAREPAQFGPDQLPVFVWDFGPLDYLYGMPDVGDGVKVGRHLPVQDADPDTIDRAVGEAETEAIRADLARYLPDAAGPLREAQVCLYTNTPDAHFLIDFHHRHRQVIIASPCSGHGFKFSAAIGEVLADLAMEGRSRFDLGLFRLDRMLAPQAAADTGAGGAGRGRDAN